MRDQFFTSWVSRLRAEDPLAWEELYSFVREWIVPRLRLPAYADAEKIVCDTVVVVWRSLRRLRQDGCFLAFVTTIARRVAWRNVGKGNVASLSSAGAAEPSTPGGQRRSLEGEEFLEKLCAAMTKGERRLFDLEYVLGASSSEIAAQLGISTSTLWKKRSVLRKKLRGVVRRLRQEEERS